MHTIAIAGLFLMLIAVARAQEEQPSIGSVATRDALVTGGLQVQGEQAKLLANASVTAYNRTAPIELTRGGNVLVCSTSRFHLQRSGTDSSLVFGLDRGAIEIHSDSQPQDVVLTPDLRMTFVSSGPLDLRLRVTPNGDTCVENTGKSAPQIAVADAFSDSSYRLRPGQHVMFEHGNLHEVVDQELSPCGCPAEVALPMQAAQNDAAKAGTAAEVAARNPFPAAVSQGLVAEAKPVTTAANASEPHTQVATTLAYSDKIDAPPASPSAPAPSSVPVVAAPVTQPPAPPGAHDLASAIGRFFHRLFHRNSPQAKS